MICSELEELLVEFLLFIAVTVPLFLYAHLLEEEGQIILLMRLHLKTNNTIFTLAQTGNYIPARPSYLKV